MDAVDQTQDVLRLRDLTFLVPASATAIALAWDVGSFIPIGGGSFNLFTVAEHIGFAAQAMPYAIVVSATMLAFALLMLPIHRAFEARRKVILATPFEQRGTKFRGELLFYRITSGVSLIGMAAAVVGSFWFSVRDNTATGVVAAMCLTLLCSFVIHNQQNPIRLPRAVVAIVFTTAATAIAMAFGADQTHAMLDGENYAIKIAGVAERATIFRAGERGVLLYDFDSKQHRFEKWEKIGAIELPVRPYFLQAHRPLKTK